MSDNAGSTKWRTLYREKRDEVERQAARAHAYFHEVERLRAAYDDLWADANEAFNRLANRDPDEAYAALRRSMRKGGGE